MRNLVAIIMLFCAGCASYVTPGGSVHLNGIDGAGTAGAVSRQPSPRFPASIAVVRVQAPHYKSLSSESYGTGLFSVVTARELPTGDLSGWPSVSGVVTGNRLQLPPELDSIYDLRLAAAKLQAGVLLVYTVDTSFRVQGHAYGPLASIPLRSVPDPDAYITSTASAVFMDVKTGFRYGTVEATARTSGLAEVWTSRDAIDKKRLETEQQAFTLLMADAEKTWVDIVKRYQ